GDGRRRAPRPGRRRRASPRDQRPRLDRRRACRLPRARDARRLTFGTLAPPPRRQESTSLTEPRDPASDDTQPIPTPPAGGDIDDEAARAEAEAAASAADEVGGEEDPGTVADEPEA